MSDTLFPLLPEQARAADPGHSVWLSASAGTGKTQVLSARVLRLLLQPGIEPGSILCLTFTKAGAAEMATRVNARLAKWVRMDATSLARDLRAIGAKVDPETQARARTLFTRVLDCPGGGLRIDTIHAFAQYLLAAFPEEAGLEPGTVAMDDRTREVLARKVLTDLVTQADEDDRSALSMLSLRLSPDGAKAWLMACAKARELWAEPGGWPSPMRPQVLQLLGLPSDYEEADLARECADGAFDTGSLRACLSTLRDWNTKSGHAAADPLEAWLAADPMERLATLACFNGSLLVADGSKPKNLSNLAKRDPAYEARVGAVQTCLDAIREKQALLALAEYLTPALELGRRFALLWDEAKRSRGLVDFDDQIARAAKLLGNSEMAQWIGYKLDRAFDHILVDEAQDTNESQWAIIDALTQDYFDGLGAAGARLRTVFVVGDYKQAIFGFQGTEPRLFVEKRGEYDARINAAMDNARELADRTRSEPMVPLTPLEKLGLERNFRSSQTILDFVDRAVAHVGVEAMGMAGETVRHRGDADLPGRVTLWAPIRADEGDDPEAVEEEGAETWLPAPERRMADRIAAQVKTWLDEGHPLTKGGTRRATAGDIMILVRKRRALAGLIVARLHAAGVPVAGVDRLRLGAPLAVKDLLAALRFATQPRDDLSLANLLVSPLGGWSQDDLLANAVREKGVTLWDHIRRSDAPLCVETAERLRALLARVDYEPPQALLQWLLTGPWDGRRKLVARLGQEANDPIDELVGAAFAFSAEHTPSLQGFLNWFDASDEELKREAAGGGSAVRVLTAHGSKGLQAPIVILADATGNPDRGPPRAGELATADGRPVPLPSLPKEARAGPVREAEEAKAAREREEHWRLMYVAMTRAEEALYIGGALLPSDKDVPEASWYAQAAALFGGEDGDAGVSDPIWGERHDLGALMDRRAPAPDTHTAGERSALPDWATRPPADEPTPPRPLAPSAAGDDLAPNPPGLVQSGEAAQRGTLIHRLLERLPDIAPDRRAKRAAQWLEAQAADLSGEARGAMIAQALAVLDHPDFAGLFAPGALAEVSLAATVEGQVVTGKLDRLCVGEEEVLVVDYKTTRRPPDALEQVPAATLRQMSAYAHALAEIYPGRKIRAALLYTQGPHLIALSDAVLAAHKPGLHRAEESLGANGLSDRAGTLD
ncbi:double-strand break repair helicase AddA [Alteriqipengyuania lutimaris]|uniref:DNA 3'-5' helicase n=1 Tax=Alteriqipengyuania lutimaris TaxID=1538146 RepID=A0A395LTI3_9SPHN|nr:double-strand break repair helicase AddA [Alteriqipengyuania lutimaris]MBB3033108.1 ATP-dependent helicase/nuclease subunit A [Alteriqipengyuania lutimaris]RDS77830.1 double-strand break repair helicase AddA [Alteriqipengyuania lutimaris]